MSNTTVQIKRSNTTSIPASLNPGELGYSYLSNTLFIGTSSGNGVLNVGGLIYTSTLDSATSANVPLTLVKRDANGAFSGTFNGNFTGTFNGSINTANSLSTTENFSISGGDISASAVGFNGTAPVTLNASLNPVPGLTAGTYGSANSIPSVTVAANGRVISISSTPVLSGNQNFTILANTGTSTFYTGNTLSFVGAGPGIVTNTSSNVVSFGFDNTVVRSNVGSGSVQTIISDLVLMGNVTVVQTAVQSFNIFSTTVQTGDSLLELAANNTVADTIDIGFYGASNTGSSVVYHGLIREGSAGTSAKNFYLFQNLPTNPTGNTVSYASLQKANLIANITQANVSNLSAAIFVSDGGTGLQSLSSGSLVYGSGNTTQLSTLAIGGVNSILTSTGTGPQWTSNGSLVVGTANVSLYDSVTTFTSGVSYLQLSAGISGNFVTGANSALSFNSTTGALSATSFIGNVSSSNIIGTMTVSQGGTGATSFLANSVIINPTSSTTGPLSSVTGTQGQVLQINSGIPTFAMLDGGSF